MTNIYARMQSTATRLLNKYQQGSVVLSRAVAPTPGTHEWDAPTDNDPLTWTLNAVVKGVSFKYIDGVNIIVSDLEVTMPIFADEPKLSDNLVIDDKPSTIIKIIRIPAAGTVVAWKMIVR